ncbi:hypothetical protein PB1_11054 [Bacillus methanolicus PB1]|uniref:Uncharacterized protein n=1 Tax=Bacillus methanolicus PB1 TaxID=997296 RepID=I3DV22_BACMT|nr:hypothetical protein PB1_11054 [Bacillus methanolicus PB1]
MSKLTHFTYIYILIPGKMTYTILAFFYRNGNFTYQITKRNQKFDFTVANLQKRELAIKIEIKGLVLGAGETISI